jgi:hypothetical protein
MATAHHDNAANDDTDKYFQMFELVFFRPPLAMDFPNGQPRLSYEDLERAYHRPNPEYRRRLAWDHISRVFRRQEIEALLALDDRIQLREKTGETPLD